MEATNQVRKAARILHGATRGRCRTDSLTGPSNVGTRAAIFAALRGIPKVPKAQAGINALEAAFFCAAGVEGSCLAVRRQVLAEFCRDLVGEEDRTTDRLAEMDAFTH